MYFNCLEKYRRENTLKVRNTVHAHGEQGLAWSTEIQRRESRITHKKNGSGVIWRNRTKVGELYD